MKINKPKRRLYKSMQRTGMDTYKVSVDRPNLFLGRPLRSTIYDSPIQKPVLAPVTLPLYVVMKSKLHEPIKSPKKDMSSHRFINFNQHSPHRKRFQNCQSQNKSNQSEQSIKDFTITPINLGSNRRFNILDSYKAMSIELTPRMKQLGIHKRFNLRKGDNDTPKIRDAKNLSFYQLATTSMAHSTAATQGETPRPSSHEVRPWETQLDDSLQV